VPRDNADYRKKRCGRAHNGDKQQKTKRIDKLDHLLLIGREDRADDGYVDANVKAEDIIARYEAQADEEKCPDL
jgi:hypothetical protein